MSLCRFLYQYYCMNLYTLQAVHAQSLPLLDSVGIQNWWLRKSLAWCRLYGRLLHERPSIPCRDCNGSISLSLAFGCLLVGANLVVEMVAVTVWFTAYTSYCVIPLFPGFARSCCAAVCANGFLSSAGCGFGTFCDCAAVPVDTNVCRACGLASLSFFGSHDLYIKKILF